MKVSPWRRLVAASCLAIGIGSTAYMKSHYGPGGHDSIARLGRPLPSLVVDAGGSAIDLKTLVGGRRSVIMFYSPACRVCRETLPALQPFPASLQLILVSEAQPSAEPDASHIEGAACFFDRWEVLRRFFAIAALPTILFIDEKGILRDGMVGSYERDRVRRKLQAFAQDVD